MANKPNLLFILTDQQRADTLGCYGNNVIQTPNLDALARESFVFENAYVSQPVCTPSRATIMTGLYPHTHGCITNNTALGPRNRTIAEMVSGEYICSYYGKWHLGDELVPQHGFDKWLSTEDQYRAPYSSKEYLSRLSDYHRFLVKNGFRPDSESYGAMVFARVTSAKMPEQFTKASFQAQEAARFFQENKDRPFVLYVGFLEPHPPHEGPFSDMYPHDKLATGPHFLKEPPKNASLRHRIMADYYMHGGKSMLSSEVDWRKLRARYWGNVTLVDRAVGTILRALEESGLDSNTIVVYTSEHGDMAGDHGINGKLVMYEESIKVPLIMRVPWLGKEGRALKGRISQVDLVPTLLDLMEEPVPGELQGESRLPLLHGETSLEANDVIVQWNGHEAGHEDHSELSINIPKEEADRVLGQPWRTIISPDGWKLNLSPVDQCELYNLNADPHEQANLYDEPGQRDRVRDLVSRIRRWQERTGDKTPLPPTV